MSTILALFRGDLLLIRQDRVVPMRELPVDLVAALRLAREVEHAAVNRTQRNLAVAATGRLMLACVEAGWRIHELAAVLGVKRSAAQMRVKVARDRGFTTEGLDVSPPPRRPPTRAEQLTVPVEQREWLTSSEAAAFAGVGVSTIPRWRSLGFLPNTMYVGSPRPLYLRADLLRIMTAPRAANGGIDEASAAAWVNSPASD